MARKHLALSLDGRYLFVAGSGNLTVFSRDAETGSLSFTNADFDVDGGVPWITPPSRVSISADGSNLFYASGESLAVFVPAGYRRATRRYP